MINTPLSSNIAQIEISNIADNIYNYSSVSFFDAILININLWRASEWLNLALLNLTAKYDDIIVVNIQKAVINLGQTKCMINLLH